MVNPVEQLLQDKQIRFIPHGKDLLINCLNPDHPDKNPSLRIDKHMGIGQCFSCGFKINIFKFFGIVTDLQGARVQKLKEKIAKIFAATKGLELPKGFTPYIGHHRGIKPQTYQLLEAFTHKDFEDRIVVPMRDVTGKIVMFLGRHLLSDAKPRYMAYPADTEPPLYPARIKHNNGTILMVEGMFDYINLLDKGCDNAVAILGTNTLLSKRGINKDKTTQLKLQGVTKIILVFDADDAGRKATEAMTQALENEGFIVDSVDLPEGMDPGELSADEVSHLKSLV